MAALVARGARVAILAWDDPSADFSRAPVAVIRSTWNYIHRRDDFCAWAERTAGVTKLLNPADVIRENTEKGYLLDLPRRGVPIVDTLIVDAGSDPGRLVEELGARGWRDVVVKPTVSAGSFATKRFETGDAEPLRAFLEEHLPARSMMAQPYQENVATSGERSHIWIDGTFTHVARKSPRFADEPFGLEGPLEADDDERVVASRALAPYEGRVLYARVDLVRDAAGEPRVMELELTEPYLMLGMLPRAVGLLADAIIRHVERSALARRG